MRPQKNDSGVSNPIGAAEFHGFVNRICEGTEQIQKREERIWVKK